MVPIQEEEEEEVSVASFVQIVSRRFL